MKKIVIIIMVLAIVFFVIYGICNMKKDEPVISQEQEKEQIEEQVEEKNKESIPIALYTKKGNSLTKAVQYKGEINSKKDIETFQAFPSNEDEISYSGKHADAWQNYWNKNGKEGYHIGFYLEYLLTSGEKVEQVVISPEDTEKYYDYIELYLYDSVIHKNDSWYSHITKQEFNEKTNITSIKLTAGSKIDEVVFPVKLTVFTYNDKENIDKDGYTITIQ